MSALSEILAQSVGAQFLRADLHIHSYGASHDVKDASMTSAAIVQTAVKEGLSIVAITDHNEISNVESALEAARDGSVLVIPGVELSTSQGHLLCYVPTLELLRQFHGRLSIVERGTATSRCQQSLLECLNLLRPLGGFAILAHVDIPNGFESEVPGASPHKADILCHGTLLGIELKHASSSISYADGDPDTNRVKLGRERTMRLKLASKQNLARVLNSDAHALQALGRNAATLSRVTRYKMDTPSFHGLRVSLEDADARVRIEDHIPPSIPKILGAQLDGGFLRGQVIRFSPNLNCIIGGRGTGKSTIFESIRSIARGNSDSKVIDSDVWPESLHLIWEDQAGERHYLLRQKECAMVNMDNEFLGPTEFEVDCFGQGEAARISHEAQTDPLALLRYLDRFVDLDAATKAEEQAREDLLTLQTRIEKAEQQVDLIPQHERLLSTTQQQLAALRKAEVKELIELHRQLATERALRTQIIENLETAKDSAERETAREAIKTIRELADPADLSVGVTEFQIIAQGASSLEAAMSTADGQIREGLNAFEASVTSQISSWRSKESAAQKMIDEKRRELEALNVQFDMSYIAKLTRDEANHQQAIKTLTTWKSNLADLRKQRAEVLKNRWAARERVATLRDAFARKASQVLAESLSDLRVSLKYTRNAHSPDAVDQIIQAMGWRTNQQPRAIFLVEDLTVPDLLQAIQRDDSKPIAALRTPDGAEIFDRAEAKAILEKLSAPTVKFALERARLHDLPRLQVTKAVPNASGGTRYIVREFAKLSLGQQQSVLLALILSSDTNRPLIIDQPEDNLDGEFIYSTLVPVLRRAKERRQVIIVTHNPNVAVLGDAELIVIMKAANDYGLIVARGSIDHPQTRDMACAILEGAREAFIRRAKMYGVHVGETI
jgi:ABC-type cobalamin/Fe3+-siderophores transport system ATPase subunit/histidinol phosphatase-like PHP family hydrolase